MGPLLSIVWADVGPLTVLLCPPALCGGTPAGLCVFALPQTGDPQSRAVYEPSQIGGFAEGVGPVHPHSVTCARSAFPAPARGAGSHGPQGKDKHIVRSPRALLVPDLL